MQPLFQIVFVAAARRSASKRAAASRAAMDEFEVRRVKAAEHTVWVTGCRSWYLDDRGIPAVWPWKFARFREELVAPDLEAYDLR